MKKVFRLLILVTLALSLVFPSSLSITAAATTAVAETTNNVGPISLPVSPMDTAIDPDHPVVYLTDMGGDKKTLYAANYETGEIKTLVLPYPADRLEVYNGKLYITQQMMEHNRGNLGPYKGAIAEVDTASFTLISTFNVDVDPYDLAIDANGYIYITSASGEWNPISVYSLKDKVKIPAGNAPAYNGAPIYYNPVNSKIYTIDGDIYPRYVRAYEFENGKIKNYYKSTDNIKPLEWIGEITPDGKSMYNMSGVVIDLAATQSGDMKFKFDFGRQYVDYAFSLTDQLTFAGDYHGGIDVYNYQTNEFLYTLKENANLDYLFYKDGLIAIYRVNGHQYLEKIEDYGPGVPKILNRYSVDSNGEKVKLYDSIKNIPVDGNFLIEFNQLISIKDPTKITINSAEGSIPVELEVIGNSLMIIPELLDDDRMHWLDIKPGAVAGLTGEELDWGYNVYFYTEDIPPQLIPLIGKTRYETATMVSQVGWETSNTVLFVNGGAIVDGLTATPLAAAKDAPILLTRNDTIPPETLAELTRLKTKEIILIGGTGVISSGVESLLKTKGFSVKRIGGANRFDTSLLIAKELDKITDVDTIYVAYGWGEPDALSIAAQAGLTMQPIILTNIMGVPALTMDWLKSEALEDAYFIGGNGVIDWSVIDAINTITTGYVGNNRISGYDRHETNAKVISAFYPENELSAFIVAKSETVSLVDALTAGPLAAKLGAPVILVSSTLGLRPMQQTTLKNKTTEFILQIGGGVRFP